MIDNGIIGIGFGAYLGAVCHARWHPGMMTRRLVDNEPLYKPLLRVLLGICICIPVMALYLVTSEQIANVYVLSLMKTFLPTFTSGFLVFGVHDHLCEKIGLLRFKEDDESAVLKQPLLSEGTDEACTEDRYSLQTPTTTGEPA